MYAPAILLVCLAALPAAVLGDSATCGSVYYDSNDVGDAAEAACEFVQNGGTAGSSSYPHQYHNYEGFEFKGLDGPFYEFPILASRVYSGGSPGADRVVITEHCTEAGVITHRGAGGNSFEGCEIDVSDPAESTAPTPSDEPGSASLLSSPFKSAAGLGLAFLSYFFLA